MGTTVTKKEKKEKKFNSERTARIVKNALKSVFPKDNFIVSSFVDRVEVMYFDNTVCTASELNIFTSVFCIQNHLKKEQLQFSKIKKETAAAPAVAK